MKKVIRLLTPSDAPAYHALMVQSFASAEGFTVSSEAKRWGNAETYYPTFGIFHDDVLVAMLRTEWVLTQKELDFKLGCHFTHPELKFPAMYLAKAATLPGSKSQGLNSVLRFLSLRVAQHWGARFVFGVMVEGSPRVFTMLEMGYEFQKLPKSWNGNFVSANAPMLGVLDMEKKGSFALQYLKTRVTNYLSDCEVQFDVRQLHIIDRKDVRWPWSA
jgi:hypothetical protein